MDQKVWSPVQQNRTKPKRSNACMSSTGEPRIALFHSQRAYGIQLRGYAPSCHRLLLLQKWLRIITPSDRLEHEWPLFCGLGILTVHSQCVFDCLWHVKTHESKFFLREELHSHRPLMFGILCLLNTSVDYPKQGTFFWPLKCTVNHLPGEVRLLKAMQFRRFVK